MIMACDICCKTGTTLADLLAVYQTPDIKSICPDCETIVNQKHRSLLHMVLRIKSALMKRFLSERKKK